MKNLKYFLIVAAFTVATGAALAADIGVSVSIGQPGFYGRIDLGNMPQPQLIYPAPVIIQQVPVGVVRQPIYLRVPPGHEKKWAKHCRRYNACGQPVYFVQQDWYTNVYAPGYRSAHSDRNGEHGKGYDKMKKEKKEKKEKN